MAQNERDQATLGQKTNPQPSDAKDEKLEEIIVTARKQQESLQQVPVSVVAVSGEEIEARSIDSLSDLGQSTPNFSFTQSPTGGRTESIIYMRGVGPSTGSPTVGVYMDGVYLASTRTSDLEMVDLERVEVLRGPQGTLFGKNTSGGAVNIVTRKPDVSAQSVTGRMQVTGGSRDRFELLGSANVPLSPDRLALQASISRRKQDGYGRRADGQDMANTDRTAGRVALRWQPTDSFGALLSADVLDYDETAASKNLVHVFVSPTSPVALSNAVSGITYDSRWVSPDPFFSNATGPNRSSGTIWGSALTLDLDLGWAALKSISAYRAISAPHGDQDADGSPVTVLAFFTDEDQRHATQEFQLTGSSFDDRLDWLLGAFYFHEVRERRDGANLLGDMALALTGDFNALSFGEARRDTLESQALFSQLNYKLTDALRATMGVRLSRDEAQDEVHGFDFVTGAPTSSAVPRKKDWNDVSPRFGLDYQWTPDVMTYVSAAKGYKQGGVDPTRPPGGFEPEKVWTYELGLRSEFFDRRLRLNATYFYSDYTDLQMTIGGATTDPVTGGIQPFDVTDNIPGVRITGAEVELSVVPVTGLKLTGGLGLVDAKYTDFPADPQWQNTALAADAKFPFTPEVAYTLGVEHSRQLFSSIDLTARVDYAHKSEIFYNLANTAVMRQKPYGLLDARLTFERAGSGLSVSIFGTNLTDEDYFVAGFDNATIPNAVFGFAFTSMGPPREYGISAQWRF